MRFISTNRCHRLPGVTLTDVLIVLVMVVLLSSYAIFSAGAMSETARRVKCASNLRQIGQAILLYANENKGAYPRASYDAKSVDTPVWGTPYPPDKPEGPQPGQTVDPFAKEKDAEAMMRPDANDVTAAMYLLLRTQDITSEVFVCPSSRLKPWDFGGGTRTALDWTNFAGTSILRDHLSYAYVNPYPSKQAISKGYKLNFSIPAEFATVADMGPGDDALLTLTKDSNAEAMQHGNSFNHFSEGQNILFGDGHVEFNLSPFVGVERDNIYTAGGPEVKGREGAKVALVGAPVDEKDSILLPTAKSIGYQPKPRSPVKAITADQFKDAFAGTYTMVQREGMKMPMAKLTIDGKEILIVSGPATIRFGYEPLGTRDDEYSVRLTAPDTQPTEVDLTKTPDGVLSFSSDSSSTPWAGILMQVWKRQ